MENKLVVHYDDEGDVLEIRMGEPTESYMKDLGDDIFERRDEETENLKGFTIFNFKKRSASLKDININLPSGLIFS